MRGLALCSVATTPPGLQGLRYGQLNNRLIFNLLISVSAAGREARTRGVVFNMLGDYTAGTASLGIDVIENRFTKGTDGIWRIREMRIFPIMATHGMYPNNAAKLEDGIWKLDVMAPDQPYFSSPSFTDGWARKASAPLPRPVVKNAIEPLRNFPRTSRAARCRSAIMVRCPATSSCGRTSSRCGLPTAIR